MAEDDTSGVLVDNDDYSPEESPNVLVYILRGQDSNCIHVSEDDH
jgi:hypothetical protein